MPNVRLAGAFAALVLLVPLVPLAPAEAPLVDREHQPVVLLGALLPEIAAEAVYAERPPAPMQEEVMDGRVLAAGAASGWPVDAIAAWRVSGDALQQVPVQVDERFPRYFTNYASGFGMYSQADWELTYAFDMEGKRKQCHDEADPYTATFCGARTTSDPVPGLDTDDEVVLLWRDMGPRLEAKGALLEVAATDPLTRETRYAYLEAAPAPVAQPWSYVTYARDADADVYVQANRGSYGGGPGGPCFPGDGVDTPWGEPKMDCSGRRPKDSATVTTGTYSFHYSGRWKLDGLVLDGVDILDRWKGRAFQQRRGNVADIGGFEDETYWAKSSVTLGEKAGPVRVLRETLGADSGTNVARLDVFYAKHFVQVYYLRVHPIPPDGLYAFWDHRAGTVETYYTALRPEGVPIDGQNDELYGTNSEWQQDHLGQAYFTVDAPDPTLSGLVANEMWDQVSGARGSMVTYVHTPSLAPGALTPYYRDDLAFDDGTGSDPQPQGSWGAHGIHFFFTSDTDNLFLPAPVSEFVATSTQWLFPTRMPNVGEQVAAFERAPFVVARS